MRYIVIPAVAVLSAMMPAGALSAKEASGAMNIQLVVPEVCNVSAEQFVVTETGEVTGTVLEYCNTSTGFYVVASYRPLQGGERASVRYGENQTNLDESGLSPLATRFGQRITRIPVTVKAQELGQPLAVAFSVMAI